MQQYQMNIRITPTVKKLIIINLAIWMLAVVILQGFILKAPLVTNIFGFTPNRVFTEFWVWQPFTYMFLHSNEIFHVLFNMLALWMFGSDLEQRWGRKFFLQYYFVSGVGAAIIYLFGVYVYYAFTGNTYPTMVPVVGASGAVFGILIAYGMLFGERTVYFMGLFPMKAKILVAIIGFVEAFTLLSQGFTSQVANLCHLGGLVAGFLYLWFQTRWRLNRMKSDKKKAKSRLKLVVDNEKSDGKPRYWH